MAIGHPLFFLLAGTPRINSRRVSARVRELARVVAVRARGVDSSGFQSSS
jgi:hypothetical protein